MNVIIICSECKGYSLRYYYDRKIPEQNIAPQISFKILNGINELRCNGFVEVELSDNALTHVEFAAKQGDSDWTLLGTDTNKPYRIYIEKEYFSVAEKLSLRASTSAYASKQQTVMIDIKLSTANGTCE